jgi:hypothetical protein
LHGAGTVARALMGHRMILASTLNRRHYCVRASRWWCLRLIVHDDGDDDDDDAVSVDEECTPPRARDLLLYEWAGAS